MGWGEGNSKRPRRYLQPARGKIYEGEGGGGESGKKGGVSSSLILTALVRTCWSDDIDRATSKKLYILIRLASELCITAFYEYLGNLTDTEGYQMFTWDQHLRWFLNDYLTKLLEVSQAPKI